MTSKIVGIWIVITSIASSANDYVSLSSNGFNPPIKVFVYAEVSFSSHDIRIVRRISCTNEGKNAEASRKCLDNRIPEGAYCIPFATRASSSRPQSRNSTGSYCEQNFRKRLYLTASNETCHVTPFRNRFDNLYDSLFLYRRPFPRSVILH